MKREVASGTLSTACTCTARLLLAVLGSLTAGTRAASARSASPGEGKVTSTVIVTVACRRRRIEAAEAEDRRRRRRSVPTVMVMAAASTVRPAALRIASTA